MRRRAAIFLCCFVISSAATAVAADKSADRKQAEQAQSELNASRMEATYNSGSTFVRDAAVDAYLARIVERLVAANPDAGAVPVRIHALRAPLPYVFGLDNGAVYVSTGLLARLRKESQLAGLIATEIAPIVRHDNVNGKEATRQRMVRRAIPNILLVTVTAGIAAFPLTKADADAQRNLDAQLRLDSDKLALGWLQRAGYDSTELPKGLERLRATLSVERRSGLTELANDEGLNARLESLKTAMAAISAAADANAPAAAPPVAASTSDELAPLAHRFAVELIREDMGSAGTKYVPGLLDWLDADNGPTGEIACLRAEFTRKSIVDPTHVPDAIRAYETCVGFADAPPVSFRELGFLQRKNGDGAAAKKSFERYLERAPTAVDAPIIRGYMEGL